MRIVTKKALMNLSYIWSGDVDRITKQIEISAELISKALPKLSAKLTKLLKAEKKADASFFVMEKARSLMSFNKHQARHNRDCLKADEAWERADTALAKAVAKQLEVVRKKPKAKK